MRFDCCACVASGQTAAQPTRPMNPRCICRSGSFAPILACPPMSAWRATSDIPVIKINRPNPKFRRIPPGSTASFALPRNRLPADVAATEPFRPFDAVDRGIGASLGLRGRSCRARRRSARVRRWREFFRPSPWCRRGRSRHSLREQRHRAPRCGYPWHNRRDSPSPPSPPSARFPETSGDRSSSTVRRTRPAPRLSLTVTNPSPPRRRPRACAGRATSCRARTPASRNCRQRLPSERPSREWVRRRRDRQNSAKVAAGAGWIAILP